MASGVALATPRRPAPKVSTTSPHSRPSVGRVTPDSAAFMESAGTVPVSASHETFASEDFTAPIVERRLTPQPPPEPHAMPPADEEPTKEDGSTLSKYIERFRRNQPLSRVDRARSGLQAQPVEFWWKEPGADLEPRKAPRAALRPAVGVAFTSPFGNNGKRVRFIIHTPRDHLPKAAPKSRIPKLRRTPQEEAERQDSPEDVTTVTSCLAVSTDGLSSSTGASSILRPPLASIDVHRPSLDEEEEEEEEDAESKAGDLTFRPMFLGVRSGIPDLFPAARPPDPQDDILAKWRLKNQMEIARQQTRHPAPATPAPEPPARHHFVRSTARPAPCEPPAKERRETGTQMSTPCSLLAVDAAVGTEQSVVVSRPPSPPPPPGAASVCHCPCAAATREVSVEKKKKKAKKAKRRKEEEARGSYVAPSELPPLAARPPSHSAPRAGDAVIGDVVTRDLFSCSLRSSLNSMFPASARQSLERDLESSVPEAEDDVAALERLASREEERAAHFGEDLVLQQLTFQLQSSLEQIRLIDEQLHFRQSIE